MKVYTYSQARQRLASLLHEASRTGVVKIRRRDGAMFELAPSEQSASGLDVPGIATGVQTAEILAVLRESRARTVFARVRAGPARPATRRRGPRRVPRRRGG